MDKLHKIFSLCSRGHAVLSVVCMKPCRNNCKIKIIILTLDFQKKETCEGLMIAKR